MNATSTVAEARLSTSDAMLPVLASVGTPCEYCGSPIVEDYFSIRGQVACPACRNGIEGSLLRAFAYGLGAACGCVALYYLLYALLHQRFALIAVLAGVVVGGAVRRGADASQRLRHRALALLLTYLAVVATYASAVASLPDVASISQAVSRSLTLPFVMLAQGKNVVTLVLLVFGLLEAWKFSAPPRVIIDGPFSAEPAPQSPAST